MWLFLLILLILFLVVPAIRAYMAYRRLKNRFNEMFGFGDGARRQPRERRGHNESQQQQPRRKKIDPSVGEYVEFEEIAVSGTTEKKETAPDSGSFTAESRIVDVEWEDIKD